MAVETCRGVLPAYQKSPVNGGWSVNLPPDLTASCGFGSVSRSGIALNLAFLAEVEAELLVEGPSTKWHPAVESAVHQRLEDAVEAGEDPLPWIRLWFRVREPTVDVRECLPDRDNDGRQEEAKTLLQGVAEHLRLGSKIRILCSPEGEAGAVTLQRLGDALVSWQLKPEDFDIRIHFWHDPALECAAADSVDLIYAEPDTPSDFLIHSAWPTISSGGMLIGEGAADSELRAFTRANRLMLHESPPIGWWVQKGNGVPFCLRRERILLNGELGTAHFNPGLARDPKTGALVCVFRTKATRWEKGRIYGSELHPSLPVFRTVPQPLLARSDHDPRHEEDPRLFFFRGELWVSFTMATLRPRFVNSMAFARLRRERDGGIFADPQIEIRSPKGADREKNWLPFEHHGKLLIVYSFAPWEIREIDFSSGSAEKVVASAAEIIWAYGAPRGGSQPFRAPNGNWWMLFHSSTSWPGGKRYFAGAVEMDAATLLPLRQTWSPLFYEHIGEGNRRRLQVCWPGGAVVDGDHVLVSLGRNDEECWLGRIPVAEFDLRLMPLIEAPKQ